VRTETVREDNKFILVVFIDCQLVGGFEFVFLFF
jgi:hypothetical protein